MTAPYYALLTNIGAAKLANATATDTRLNITRMAVGDANGTVPTPDPAQTGLINERHRADLNTLKVDPKNPNQIIAEQVLPDDVGGWWIRELGLYDDDGDLIAVGNCPPSYKPLLAEGAGREQVIRIILIVSSTDAVTLKIDPAVVLATREYVDDAIEAHARSRNHPDATTSEKGFVQLSNETDSDDETKAATPKAVKAVKATADAAVKTVNSESPDDSGNVQLGSAADADIVTSMKDTTPGRVPVVGWMGPGGSCVRLSNAELMSAQGFGTSLFAQGNSPGADDHFGAYGCGVHMLYGKNGDGSQMLSANLFVDSSGDLSVEWLAIKASDGSVVTRILQKVFTTAGGTVTGNVAVKGYVSSGDARTLILSSSNTSTLGASIRLWGNADRPTVIEFGDNTSYHFYSQRNNDGSISLKSAGTVEPSNWTNFDARYVKGIQLGARVATGDVWGNWGDHIVPDGCVLVGFNSGRDSSTVDIRNGYYKPIQGNINGTWVTISG